MADRPRATPAGPPLGVIATVPPIPQPMPMPIPQQTPPAGPPHPWSISRLLGPSEHVSADSSEPAAKRRRTVSCADGCTWCRKKKIKCSGRPQDAGPCTNCARDGLPCSFVAGPSNVSRVTPSQDVTEAGTPRKRAQRACRECHAHKTKCSGSQPACARCTNLGILCVYEPSKRKFSSAPGSGPSPSAVTSPQGVAPAYLLKGTANVEAKQLVSPTTSSASPGPSAPTGRLSLTNYLCAEDLLAQKETLTRHFHVWFKLFGRLPLLAILHPQSTFLQIEQKRLDPTLGQVVCAVTARIICPRSRRLPEFAEKCTELVDLHIFRNISSALRCDGRHSLMILIIAICHNWLEFQMGKVWMYMGLAGRMCDWRDRIFKPHLVLKPRIIMRFPLTPRLYRITALQLNCVDAGDTPIQQEISRRMVWAVWNIDRFLAGGFEEHLVLKDEYMRVKMPVMDLNFPGENDETASAASSDPPQPSTSDSQPHPLCVYHIKLNRVRHHILSFTKQLPIPPTPDKRGVILEASGVINRVTGLQKVLSSFNANLPAHIKISNVTMERWVNLPESGSFIMLWTNFWGLYIELYLFSIPGLREEANPELSRELPNEFVIKSQKQAVAYAISLSQFWRSVSGIVAKRSIIDGTERLYTVDQTLIMNIIQSTKVLLAAREHQLFHRLQEDSTAPLPQQEPVTDEVLESLIQHNMGLFEQFEQYYPVTIERLTVDLRAAVENLKRRSHPKYPQQAHEVSERRPPEDIRLPGPHLMLESAIASPQSDDRDMQRNHSAAEEFMRQRLEQAPSAHVATPTTTAASEASMDYLPKIPEWLNHARAQEIPPGVPALPKSNVPQGQRPPESTMFMPRPWPRTAFGPEQLISTHYQLERAVPGALGVSDPHIHNPAIATTSTYGSIPMQYDRARGGSRITRAPFQPDYNHYERAAGKRLPFPEINTLSRNDNTPLM